MPVQTTYPGVYIQERPSGVHTISGVSTSVTAFAGAAQKGPVDTPVRLFNFADFTRTFGEPLSQDQPLAYAVQHFFANGGGEAVVVRIAAADAKAAFVTLKDLQATSKNVLTLTARGRGAWANFVSGKQGVEVDTETANTANPADLFNLTVTRWEADPRSGQPQMAEQETFRNMSMSPKHPRYALTTIGASSIVTAALASQNITSSAKGSSTAQAAVADPLTIKASNNTLRLSVDYGPQVEIVLFPGDTAGTASISKTPAQIVTELNTALAAANLAATASQASGKIKIESNNGSMDSAVVVSPASEGDISKDLKLGVVWGGTEVSGSADLRPAPVVNAPLTGGVEGGEVTANDIVPPSGVGGLYSLGALRFPRFNLLCLPSLSSNDGTQIGSAMSYCKREHAFLIVDSPAAGLPAIPPDLTALAPLGEHGALYYPRLTLVETPPGGAPRTLKLPASGAIAGVMARTDTERGIWKAPAGMAAGIVGVNDISAPTDDTVSGQLNPNGVNVLRKFPGAGIVVWGARTLKGSDTQSTDFKYVPIRRLTDYIESSLYLGTHFAVFEPNDPDLWGQLRLAVTTFMRTLFRQGAFQQSPKRDEAYSFFVTCDETVNPQSEIDLGRVNVLVGFAPLKPAEFVVLTITQISHLEA